MSKMVERFEFRCGGDIPKDAPLTIKEALENAQECLKGEGYEGGDVCDDLALAITRLVQKYPKIAKEEL